MLIVTGNPFAIAGQEDKYLALRYLLEKSGGKLVNETLNSEVQVQRRESVPKAEVQGTLRTPVVMKKKPPQPQTENELFKDMDQTPGYRAVDEATPGQPLFLADDPRDGLQDSEGADGKGQEQVVFEEDMGRTLMDSFKQKCRKVLGSGASLQPEPEIPEDEPSHEYQIYASKGSDQVDLITAYKSLKHSMHKNLKGLGRGRDLCTGKGFLRPTIISLQAERLPAGLPMPSLNRFDFQGSQLWKPDKSIPDLSNNDGRRLVTRATSRAPPGTAHGSVKVGLHGMTLYDYAGGNQWCKNGFDPSQSKGSAFSGSRYAGTAHKNRSTTAPCWRKPRYQRVDEKVQKLLDGYKQADVEDQVKLAKTESDKREDVLQKYFPGHDVPLGEMQLQGGADLDDQMYGVQS